MIINIINNDKNCQNITRWNWFITFATALLVMLAVIVIMSVANKRDSYM